MVFRNRKPIYSNEYVETAPKHPWQIGTNTSAMPSALGQINTLTLKQDDVIFISSDGISDNLWSDEIADTLFRGLDHGGLQKAADSLVAKAVDMAYDNYAICPYLRRAPAGTPSGGKPDDMTVCIAQVCVGHT